MNVLQELNGKKNPTPNLTGSGSPCQAGFLPPLGARLRVRPSAAGQAVCASAARGAGPGPQGEPTLGKGGKGEEK